MGWPENAFLVMTNCSPDGHGEGHVTS